MIQLSKLEDEKEQKKLEEEQKLLREKYAREKEDARTKLEQNVIANEITVAEKTKNQNLSKKIDSDREHQISLPMKETVVHQTSVKNEPLPTRNIASPPIPTVLKRMKKNGEIFIAQPQEKDDFQNAPPLSSEVPHVRGEIQAEKREDILQLNNFNESICITKPNNVENGQDTILSQLAEIQKAPFFLNIGIRIRK